MILTVRIFVVAFIALACVGCSTINATLETWHGSHISDFIATNGAPSSRVDTPNQSHYEWTSSGTANMPYSSTCNAGHCTTTGGPIAYSCRMTITTDSEGYIVASRARGIGCVRHQAKVTALGHKPSSYLRSFERRLCDS